MLKTITVNVEFVEIVDNSCFPTIIKVSICDSNNELHYFIDKEPIFFDMEEYKIRAEILEEVDGILKINTLNPDGIESTEGISRFYI